MALLSKLLAIIALALFGAWIMGPGKGYHASAAAVIGTETESDNFNRGSNGQYISTGGASWASNTVDFLFELQGGPIYCIPEAIGTDSAMQRTTSWGADHFSAAKITVTGTAAGSGPGVSVRCSASASTWYRVVIDAAGNYEVAKSVSGSFTSLRTGTVSYSAGTELGLSATGTSTTTIKLWYGGSQVGANITDSTSPITSGTPGLAYSSSTTTAQIDDWRGGTVP